MENQRILENKNKENKHTKIKVLNRDEVLSWKKNLESTYCQGNRNSHFSSGIWKDKPSQRFHVKFGNDFFSFLFLYM